MNIMKCHVNKWNEKLSLTWDEEREKNNCHKQRKLCYCFKIAINKSKITLTFQKIK